MTPITLHVHSKTHGEIKKHMVDLLKSHGFNIDHEHDADGHQIVVATEMDAAKNDDPSEVPAAEIDTPPIEVPAVDHSAPVATEEPTAELTVAIDPASAVAAAAIPVPDIPATVPSTELSPESPLVQASSGLTGLVTVKSLSSVCNVSFCFDTSLPCSELKVKGLTSMGDYVSFEYCSISFKFPVEKPEAGGIVANTDPQYTDTSIRAVLNPVGTEVDVPVLLKLVDGDECGVVFGQDMTAAITSALENGSNDQVPAQ